MAQNQNDDNLICTLYVYCAKHKKKCYESKASMLKLEHRLEIIGKDET